MQILIISYCFPPFNTIGGLRVGKTAKHLAYLGHDIRVVSSRDQDVAANLSLEIPRDKAVYTRRKIVPSICRWIVRQARNRKCSPIRNSPGNSQRNGLIRFASLFRDELQFPDAQVGWLPFAFSAACKLVEDWQPDVVFASGMPFTALIAGHLVHKRFGIPFVAELRDLWVDNHYYHYSPLRKRMMGHLERRVLNSASALVTVSEALADTLRDKYSPPTFVVLNGYDSADYPSCVKPSASNTFSISYTGKVWEGKQDPSPLFSAIQRLGKMTRNIRVNFYGTAAWSVLSLANRYGVQENVVIHDRIPHRDSLGAQMSSDILLFLLWNDPLQKGIYTGKLFEYLGSRRPILAIGPSGNDASDLILDRKAGFVSNDSREIRDQLVHWLELKQRSGKIPDLPVETSAGLDRRFQTEQLERIFQRIVDHSPLSSLASCLRHDS